MRQHRGVPAPHRRRGLGPTFAAVVVGAAMFAAGCLCSLAVHATPDPAGGTGEQGLLCRRAIQQAESGSGLPQGLLEGIARVESGRPDPVTGRIHPWPWTINAEGQGNFFPNKAEAIAFARQLQARGVQSIDVGCLQVNLMNHPDAFPSLEDAFDPDANARYAVRFLNQLRAKTGTWDAAAAWYHSATPELGIPYREKVVAAMAEEQKGPAYDGSSEFRHTGWPVVVAALPGLMAGHARIIMLPPASGGVPPARANAMVARATLANTSLAGMALGGGANGALGGAAISAPGAGAGATVGRGLAAYRMRPVAVARPSVVAIR
ncbi:MAG TPA: hypothetical protein VHU42_13470 [Rhodopila sp.]|nr:hypothetical protein [Rhodopila sp.]